MFPEPVIGEDAVRKVGGVMPTEVTVPVPEGVGVVHDKVVPLEVSTWPFVPTVVNPVPPLAVDRVPIVRAIEPSIVIGPPDTVIKALLEVMSIEVTVPPAAAAIDCQYVPDTPLVVKTCPATPTLGIV